MCNISRFTPGMMPTLEQTMNVVYNNWHSFGLLVRDKSGNLELTRQTPQAETDPTEIYNLLEENKDKERFLHVRHNTAGATTMDNCHPFLVYSDGKKNGLRVYFMHNGTLYDYKSKKPNPNNPNLSWIDDDDGPSDSLNFAVKVLSPYLNIDFGDGKGNIKNPLFIKTINSFWPSSQNRGILISSKHGHELIRGIANPWKEIKGEDGATFLSSNDDYFDIVKRGPELARREERRKTEEAARKKAASAAEASATANEGSTTGSRQIVSIAEVTKQFRHPVATFELSRLPTSILNDWNLTDDDMTAALGHLTLDEIEEVVNTASTDDLIFLFDVIATNYAHIAAQNKKLNEKQAISSRMISTLKAEIQSLKGLLGIDEAA